jgi:hypothetical protein
MSTLVPLSAIPRAYSAHTKRRYLTTIPGGMPETHRTNARATRYDYHRQGQMDTHRVQNKLATKLMPAGASTVAHHGSRLLLITRVARVE